MNDVGQAVLKAVTELGTRLRQVGHEIAKATWAFLIAAYDACVQFSRWLGKLISTIYLAMATFAGDFIYAAKVFYAPIVSLVLYAIFRLPLYIYITLGYLAFVLVAIVLFYKRPAKSDKLPRPMWATVAGHTVCISVLLFSTVTTISTFFGDSLNRVLERGIYSRTDFYTPQHLSTYDKRLTGTTSQDHENDLAYISTFREKLSRIAKVGKNTIDEHSLNINQQLDQSFSEIERLMKEAKKVLVKHPRLDGNWNAEYYNRIEEAEQLLESCPDYKFTKKYSEVCAQVIASQAAR